MTWVLKETDTKHNLLIAGLSVIGEKGLCYRLSDVADEAGYAKSSIAHYFKNKEEFTNEVFRYLIGKIREYNFESVIMLRDILVAYSDVIIQLFASRNTLIISEFVEIVKAKLDNLDALHLDDNILGYTLLKDKVL